MPLLFSYGTLQEERVQLATFGRRLIGTRDVLPGFERRLLTLREPAVTVLNVVSNSRSEAAGFAFEVTDDELQLADGYEAPFGYKRVLLKLASGSDAWVYLHGV